VLKHCVPTAVPGHRLLSGGQSDLDATAHLSAMNAIGKLPWALTFSYGRALQAAPQKAWSGKTENVAAGQDRLCPSRPDEQPGVAGQVEVGRREEGRLSDCRLYLVSPPKLSAANFLIPLREALDGGDVASFQLRLKHVSDDEIRRAVDILRPAVQANGAAFILNDRPDLAAELGCDGAHIGQEDASYAQARAACRKALSASPVTTAGISPWTLAKRAPITSPLGPSFPPRPRAQDPSRYRTAALVERRDGGALRRHRWHYHHQCAALIEAGADFIAVSAGGLGASRRAGRRGAGFQRTV